MEIFLIVQYILNQQHLPNPPKDLSDSSTSFQEESQESVEIRFTIEPSGLYNEEQDTSSIGVSNMDRMVHKQDCSYYKTPQLAMGDSRSIGQITFMSSPSDEHSFWVKSSRTPEDTRILSRPLVDTPFRSNITGRLQSTTDCVDEQSNFVDLTDNISVLSDELDIIKDTSQEMEEVPFDEVITQVSGS